MGEYTYDVTAKMCGYVNSIKNKQLVRLARAAGAPKDKGAGILLHKKKGNRVGEGEPLFTIYADNRAKMERAIELSRKLDPITVEGMILAKLPYVSKSTVIERTFCPVSPERQAE